MKNNDNIMVSRRLCKGVIVTSLLLYVISLRKLVNRTSILLQEVVYFIPVITGNKDMETERRE